MSLRVPRRVRDALALAERERRRLAAELGEIRPLLRLLRKRRSGETWTDAERAEIRAHLRGLREFSWQLALFALPGGLVLLPAYAWWVEKRHQRYAQRSREP